MVSSRPATGPRPWYRFTLTQQIVLGLVLGALVGWWINRHFNVPDLDEMQTAALLAKKKAWLDWITLPRDIFLLLIKVMIAPLVLGSVVQGIAGTGDLKKVGR